MQTQATARYVRVSSRKAKLVLDQIRGKPVGEALAILEYTPRAAARLITKVLRSAVANAEHNHQVRNLDDLVVAAAVADGGPMLKRVQPRAMGRAFFIRHRTSHLTIGVTDELGAGRGRTARGRRARRAPAGRAGTTAGARPRGGGATATQPSRTRTPSRTAAAPPKENA